VAYAYAALRGEYASQWRQMVIDPARVKEFSSIVRRMLAGMARYKAVEALTGVPAAFIAVAHEREAAGKWDTYLGNGDPLNKVSVHVPAGRGPFATWEAGAVDALTLQKLAGRKDWTVTYALFGLEGYNGFGYRNKGLRTPYLWGGTNLQQPGKYVADGVFSSTAMDGQPGAAALLKMLFDADQSLALPVSDEDFGTVTAPVPPTPAPVPAPTPQAPAPVPPKPTPRPPVPPAPQPPKKPITALIELLVSLFKAIFGVR
jgi:lysozyme family protein